MHVVVKQRVALQLISPDGTEILHPVFPEQGIQLSPVALIGGDLAPVGSDDYLVVRAVGGKNAAIRSNASRYSPFMVTGAWTVLCGDGISGCSA